MKSLPWLIAAFAVGVGVFGTNKLREPPPVTPESPARLVASASSDVEKGRPLDALRKLQRVPSSDRSSARARQVEGTALETLHFSSQAESRWLDALQGDPTNGDAAFQLFDLYFLSGRQADVRRLAVEFAPQQSSPSYAAAMLLEVLRQEHERAAPTVCLEYYEPVLVREPDNPFALRTVGRCFVELGRLTEGLLLLKAATEKAPDDAETLAIRLESMMDAGRGGVVVETFERATAEVKRHPRVLRAAASGYDASGNAKVAEARLQDAVKADPYDRKIRTQLSSVLARRGEAKEAKVHEVRAKELDDVRERQFLLLQNARGQKNDPSPETLRQLSVNCVEFGWKEVGEQFEKLAARRSRSKGTASP